MGAYLDLDDVCAGHEMAFQELSALRADLARVTAERDQWERVAIAQSKDAERANKAATRLGGELAGLDAMLDQDVAKSNRLTAERDAALAENGRLFHALDEIATQTTFNADVAISMMKVARAALNAEEGR